MPTPKDDSLQKHTLNLRRDDYDRMGQLFPKLGAGPAIRKLVANFVDKQWADAPNTEEE